MQTRIHQNPQQPFFNFFTRQIPEIKLVFGSHKSWQLEDSPLIRLVSEPKAMSPVSISEEAAEDITAQFHRTVNLMPSVCFPGVHQ